MLVKFAVWVGLFGWTMSSCGARAFARMVVEILARKEGFILIGELGVRVMGGYCRTWCLSISLEHSVREDDIYESLSSSPI